MLYVLCFVLLAVGLFAALTQRNIIKIIMGVAIIDVAVNMFFIICGLRKDPMTPILTRGISEAEYLERAVDPFPQAMVLTSIVIGLGVLALLVAMALRLYGRYGTYDITEMRKLRG